MKIDENSFFRESTIRICKSLDIGASMCSCMQYLSRFMPADKMYMQHYEPELGMMRTIATATPEKGEQLDQLSPLKPEARAAIENLRKSRRDRDGIFINDTGTDRISNQILKSMVPPDTSFLLSYLDIDDQTLGAVVLVASGQNRYTEDHGRLFSLLRDPFAIAMSNARSHTELLRMKNRLADDNRYLYRELNRLHGDDIIGADFGLKGVMEMVRQVAPLESPVLLFGETGVGKDLIANAIHSISPRSERPFITVNSGAIPDTLIDSELFGHEKGAFTGAREQKRGRFERAHTGTIFLDEIGELPPQAQVRLLRVLQSKEIERVGGTASIPVNVRIIAATHRNLQEMIKANQFREDLWFRLNVFPITVPPLRYRKEDIPALVYHFIERKSKQLGFQASPKLAPDAIDQLIAYGWPGNVRELENVIERTIILNPEGPLSFDLLTAPTNPFASPQTIPGENGPNDAFLTLAEMNAKHIERVLRTTGGKINGRGGAAEVLGINPNTLRGRMDKLGIVYGAKRSDGDS
ncbi:MAG: AAA family ATPase [Proteobacteria bacterium]|nr:AAA family ATPase [Pseudomonadota bacterium]